MTNEAILRKAKERQLEAFYSKNRMAILRFRMLLAHLRVVSIPESFINSDPFIEKYASRD